jgi:hypothetical protein
MATAGAAAVSPLEMIGGSEDHVRSVIVIVFRFECRRRIMSWRPMLIHRIIVAALLDRCGR